MIPDGGGNRDNGYEDCGIGMMDAKGVHTTRTMVARRSPLGTWTSLGSKDSHTNGQIGLEERLGSTSSWARDSRYWPARVIEAATGGGSLGLILGMQHGWQASREVAFRGSQKARGDGSGDRKGM